ncbi:MAG: DUF4350 domain-containing protein [Armatimonas sp.]
MKRRVSGDALLLIGLILLLAVASARIATTGSSSPIDQRPHRTVSSAQPGGWKALRLLLEANGHVTKLRREKADKWPAEAKLIVTGPEFLNFGETKTAWSKDEAAAAVSWMTRGGTLVVFTDDNSDLLRAVDFSSVQALSGKESLPANPTNLLTGIRRIAHGEVFTFKNTPDRAAVLLQSEGTPVGWVAREGQGRLVLVGSASFCDNAHLAQADNARLTLALITGFTPEKTVVHFDEYRQGFEESKSFFQIIGVAGQRLLWQVAGVLALLALSAGARFGLPVPLPPKRRLSSEYVSSVADLYRRAGARDAVLESAVNRLRSDLAGRVGLEQDAPDDELARKVAAALGGTDPKGMAATVSSLLKDCRAALAQDPKDLTQKELLELARRMEELRKETGIDGV